MKISTRFASAMTDEYEASGRKPSVAILGEHDYDELRGFAEMQRSVTDPMLPTAQSFSYMGVEVFKSMAQKTGILFGGQDT